MILTCPSCGATASANAWENDIEARAALQAIVALPPAVAKAALGYFSLFRPEQRALSWKKVRKITLEITALLAPGHVWVQGKAARPCPPQLWALAMEQMVERAATLQRPLKNHNYLRQIVWQLADQADARQEQQHRKHETDGSHRAIRPPSEFSKLGTEFNSVPQEADDGMSEIMRKFISSQPGTDLNLSHGKLKNGDSHAK